MNRKNTRSSHNSGISQVTSLTRSMECQLNLVSLFKQLSNRQDNNNRMLLESCEIESKRQLKSIIINKAALRIECSQEQVEIQSISPNGDNALAHLSGVFDGHRSLSNKQSKCARGSIVISYEESEPISGESLNSQALDEDTRLKLKSPIDALRKIHNAFKSQSGQPYAVFLSGLLSFDCIASFEKLPKVKPGENTSSDYIFYLAEELIVFDHQTHRCQIHSNIFQGTDSEKNHHEQARRIQQISELIEIQSNRNSANAPLPSIASEHEYDTKVNCDISDESFQQTVIDLKKQITAGNIFQVVPSRTFSMDCFEPLLSYQALKESNPSPYMFYMQDQAFTLFGASPESALKYDKQSNKVELYPIAGTRERGLHSDGSVDFDLDKRLEASLKLDNKEIAEHMMLVDLARNDIARISAPSSLQIPRLLEVDRYSHVMHLVSCVQGELREDLDCFHAYQACMNMGTLTGAPKIKATELIRLTEKKRRGSYGGAVGYINTHGDMDTCIVIRSAFCNNGIAHIQAGAGVVHDSDPASESEETKNKAKAVILAVQKANAIHSGAVVQ